MSEAAKILIVGEPNTGKTSSVINLTDRKDFAFFNADKKHVPIRGKAPFLVNQKLEDPTHLVDYLNQLDNEPQCKGVIIDTLTFLMAQYVTQHVDTASDTRAAWGNYGRAYREMTDRIKSFSKPVIVAAHSETKLNTQSGNMESRILLQGAVGRLGAEADYTIVVTAKQMPVAKLREYESKYLNITEDEELQGVKYVFATQLTRETVGDRTRAPMGFWDRSETYIDNNIQFILDRYAEYYGEE